MVHIRHTVRGAAAGVLIAMIGGESLARTVTYADGTALPPLWTVFAEGAGAGGGAASHYVSSGGNPDTYRRVSLLVNSAPTCCTRSTIMIGHVMTGVSYNPATQGAITSVSYSEDARPYTPFSTFEATGPLLRQDGVVYIARRLYTGIEPAWATLSASGFVAADFVAFDGGDPIDGVDDSVHPNFTASGSPIEVGFYRMLTTPLGGQGFDTETAFDNFSLTLFTPAPCLGDITGDQQVNTADLTGLLARFGQDAPPGSPAAAADLNNDGVVNTADLTTLLSRFGQSC